ncbi:uncharacterized protein NPIL_283131 [Nephila pilipes]|uniref:Uncharacterized protein n=1 Tax=Nephila pilipes TaxID=299642 RepID=A0A8X6U4L9_NEPPI|nr:uncharacterized protein NPIL_283131 [Nephila pilipes]
MTTKPLRPSVTREVYVMRESCHLQFRSPSSLYFVWVWNKQEVSVSMAALRSVPVISLRHMAMMKIAILVCNDPDIQKFLKINGGEPSVFPSKETQIYLEKVARQTELTSVLDLEETCAWKSIFLDVNCPRPLAFAAPKDRAFTDMRKGILPFKKWEELVERKISSFSLPPLLRVELIDVIRSVAAEIDQWFKDNNGHLLNRLQEKRSVHDHFQWNSLGKIDREKTARTLINVEGLHEEEYFDFSLVFMNEMFSLLLGKNTKRLLDSGRWCYCADLMWEICTGESGTKYIAQPYSPVQLITLQRYSPYPSTGEQNLQCINSVMSKKYIQYEELLFCLSQVTDVERESIFKNYPFKLLMYFLDWPLQCEFLNTAKRLLPYFTANDFRDILVAILYERIMLGRKDFDYINLLKEFWSISPSPFKQNIKTDLMYKSLMYTLNFPGDEIFPHEKLFEHFIGSGLTFCYRGVKYFLTGIEEPYKLPEVLHSDHFISYRDYKLCCIFYVCKLRMHTNTA